MLHKLKSVSESVNKSYRKIELKRFCAAVCSKLPGTDDVYCLYFVLSNCTIFVATLINSNCLDLVCDINTKNLVSAILVFANELA